MKKYLAEQRLDPAPLLIALLGELARGTSPEVFAVTSLGHLRLTRASDYEQETRFDMVWITPKGTDLVVSHIVAGRREPSSEVVCNDIGSALRAISAALGVVVVGDAR